MLRCQRVLEYYVLLNDIRHKKCRQPIWRRRVESLQVLVRMMMSWRKGGVNNEGLILSMSHRRKDDEGGLPSSGGGDLPSKVWESTLLQRNCTVVSEYTSLKKSTQSEYSWLSKSTQRPHIYVKCRSSAIIPCWWWTSCLEPRKSCIVAPPLPL